MWFLLDAWTSRRMEGGWGKLSVLGGSWFGGKGLQFISGWAQSSQQAALHYAPALRALWFHAGQGIVSSATHILEM